MSDHGKLNVRLQLAEEEIARLREAIRVHRDQPGDDRCWQDDDVLYATLPEGHRPRAVLDPETMRKNCDRYIECRIKGLPYQTEQERIDAAVAEAVRGERGRCVAICEAEREANKERLRFAKSERESWAAEFAMLSFNFVAGVIRRGE